MRSFAIATVSVCLAVPAAVSAQGSVDPRILSGVYKKPHEVGIDVAAVTRAEQSLAGPNPDCAAIKESISREIAKFTTQFVGDKRIQEERRTEQYDPRNLDKNTIRLLALARSKTFGRMDFLGESPLMYRMHSALGRCFEREQEPYRALSEYAMAMRYSAFEQPWTGGVQPVAAAGLSGEALAQREDRYLLMLEGFASDDRLQQIAPEERPGAAGFRAAFEDYLRLKRESRAARMRIDAFIARRARGDTSVDPQQARTEFEDLDRRRVARLETLEGVRLGAYRTYHEGRSRRDGGTAYRMALLIKELETRNKKLARILNRSSFYRGRGDTDIEESTALRRFVGYALFLELANKLDPENTDYIALLAEEYRTSRVLDRAIAFEERFIELRKPVAGAQAEVAAHLRRLGGMFTDTRNFVRAVESYEEALRLAPDLPEANVMRLHLADLLFSRTGGFARAAALYSDFLTRSAGVDTARLDFRALVEHHVVRFRAHRNVASVERRRQRTDAERAALNGAVVEHRALETRLLAFRKEQEDLQIRINNVKRTLLGREDTALQLEYFRMLRRDMPDIRERVQYLETHLASLNLPHVLEQQALISWRRNRLEEATGFYREMLLRGDGTQQTRARENMSRLAGMLSDGLRRPPVLPPDFER